jgi:phosphoglucomutase
MEAIRSSGVKIGIDPLGGARVHFWQPIIERYGIAATIVSDVIDPTFRFMTVDWDGNIRVDCSSPYAMAWLIGMRDEFDVAFANDTDADRHGIVTPSNRMMNPTPGPVGLSRSTWAMACLTTSVTRKRMRTMQSGQYGALSR